MKYIKKYNEALTIGGSKKEELDLEYIKNCLAYILDKDETEIEYKHQFLIGSPFDRSKRWSERYYQKDINWVPEDRYSGEKVLTGILLKTHIETSPDKVNEIPEWCDRVKSLTNTIIGSMKNIKEEYPNYYIECWYEENGFDDNPPNSLVFNIEILSPGTK